MCIIVALFTYFSVFNFKIILIYLCLMLKILEQLSVKIKFLQNNKQLLHHLFAKVKKTIIESK